VHGDTVTEWSEVASVPQAGAVRECISVKQSSVHLRHSDVFQEEGWLVAGVLVPGVMGTGVLVLIEGCEGMSLVGLLAKGS
jgi:hypothetical protein